MLMVWGRKARIAQCVGSHGKNVCKTKHVDKLISQIIRS